MKPAGKERDIEIEKLKGYSKEVPAPDSWACNSKIALEREDGDLLCPLCLTKSYSTSWNDAKELWDELPFDKRYFENQNEDHEITYAVKILGEFIYGKDFPDAVSQAWIKWKERE